MLTVIDGAAVAAGRFVDDPGAVAQQRAADPALAHDNPLEDVFTDRLPCADLVILNKTDLLGPGRAPALCREIEARLRPGVKLVTAREGKVPPEVAFGLAAAAEDDLADRPSLHDLEAEHDHDDFESFVVTSGPVHDGEAFVSRLLAAIDLHDVLRLKGFVDRPGRDRREVVQAVGGRLQHHFDRPWRIGEKRETRLVVIGKRGLDRAAIRSALGAPGR